MSKAKGKGRPPVASSSEESDSGPEDRNKPSPPPKKAKVGEKSAPPSKPAAKKASGSGIDVDSMFSLGKMRYVDVREFRGRVLVDIREYYDADGDIRPGKKGISLTVQQFDALKESMDDITEAIKKIA